MELNVASVGTPPTGSETGKERTGRTALKAWALRPMVTGWANPARIPIDANTEDTMQDRGEGKREPGSDEDRDGIRERPGDLKDDGSTRERRRDKGWSPDDEKEENEKGERGDPPSRGV